LDSAPTSYRRTIEHYSIFKYILGDGIDGLGSVLPFTSWVCKSEINKCDVMIFDHFKNFLNRVSHT